jgi:hypothetical protein
MSYVLILKGCKHPTNIHFFPFFWRKFNVQTRKGCWNVHWIVKSIELQSPYLLRENCGFNSDTRPSFVSQSESRDAPWSTQKPAPWCGDQLTCYWWSWCRCHFAPLSLSTHSDLVKREQIKREANFCGYFCD